MIEWEFDLEGFSAKGNGTAMSIRRQCELMPWCNVWVLLETLIVYIYQWGILWPNNVTSSWWEVKGLTGCTKQIEESPAVYLAQWYVCCQERELIVACLSVQKSGLIKSRHATKFASSVQRGPYIRFLFKTLMQWGAYSTVAFWEITRLDLKLVIVWIHNPLKH